MLTMDHGARNFLTLAGSASAIFTPVGQANALPYAGCEQSFAAVCVKSAVTGLDGNLEAHVFVILGGS